MLQQNHFVENNLCLMRGLMMRALDSTLFSNFTKICLWNWKLDFTVLSTNIGAQRFIKLTPGVYRVYRWGGRVGKGGLIILFWKDISLEG